MCRHLPAVFAALMSTVAGAAAPPGAVLERLSLPGPLPGERMEVKVLRPPGHAPGRPASQFWLLDGETSLAVAAEAARLAALECEVDPPVLVAVGDGHAIGTPGNRRSRDYTPVPSEQPWARGEGGAARWLATLRAQALPAVQARIGPARERTLYGHSYGGLAVAFTWLRAPELFDRWVLASPALYYGGDWALAQLSAGPVPGLPAGGPQLLLAGSEEAWAVEGNARWVAGMAAWPAAQRPVVESLTLEGFGHLTGSPVSLMRAVRWAICRP